MVTVEIKSSEGGSGKYTMHKAFAWHYSPMFEKAFNRPFVEGQTQRYVNFSLVSGHL